MISMEYIFYDWGYAKNSGSLIVCYDCNGDELGSIIANEGDWNLMREGRDPISEGWEDGIGNVANINGWG